MVVVQKARLEIGDILRSIQFMDGKSLEIVTELTNSGKYPFQKAYDHFLLIEVDSLQPPTAAKADVKSKDLSLERLFNFTGTVEGNIIDGVVP